MESLLRSICCSETIRPTVYFGSAHTFGVLSSRLLTHSVRMHQLNKFNLRIYVEIPSIFIQR